MITLIFLGLYPLYLTVTYLLNEKNIHDMSFTLFILCIADVIYYIEFDFTRACTMFGVILVNFIINRGKVIISNMNKGEVLNLLSQVIENCDDSMITEKKINCTIRFEDRIKKKKFIKITKNYINKNSNKEMKFYINSNTITYFVLCIITFCLAFIF